MAISRVVALLLPCALSAANVSRPVPSSPWVPLGPMGLQDIQDLAVQDGKLFAAGDSGIFRSDDYGRTWKRVHGAATYALAVKGIRIYAGGDRALYRSADGGAAWRDVSGTLPKDSLYSYRIRSFAFEGRFIYAGAQGEGIFRSGDFGESWIEAFEGIDEDPLILSLLGAGDRVLAGSTRDAYLSADHGGSWVKGKKPLAGVMEFALHAGAIYAATFENGFYRSTDRGRTWMNADSGLETSGLYCLRELRGVLYAGSATGVLRLSDADGKWGPFGAGLDEETVDALTQCGPNLYAAGLDGRIHCLGPACPEPRP